MPERRLFVEFRDEFEFTKYPFMDNATLTENQGTQQIDKDLFLDASLYPIGNTGLVYISNINVQPRDVTITVSDSGRRELASVEFDPLFAPDILRLTDAYGRPAGILVSNSVTLSRFSTWAIGDHPFLAADTTFVPSCVIPSPEVGVRGVITEDGEAFFGDFILVGGNGVVFREEDDNVIRVDIVGDPLYRRRLCTDAELFETPRFIKTINNCPPDEFGNFQFVSGDHLNEESVMRIYSTEDGLVIDAAGTAI